MVLYVGFIDDALGAVGGSTALEDIGDEFAAAALADALFDGKDPAPVETIQRAINRVLERGISNDGVLGEQTFAAYRTLAKDSATRNQLLDAWPTSASVIAARWTNAFPTFVFAMFAMAITRTNLIVVCLGDQKSWSTP